MNKREATKFLSDLQIQFRSFREHLPPDKARTFLMISGDLLVSLSALAIYGMKPTNLPKKELAASVSMLSYQSYQHLRSMPEEGVNSDLSYVVSQLGFATSEVIESFDIPMDMGFNDRLLGAMLRMGRAQGALAALRSPWAKAVATGQDSDVLAALQASRKAGGESRAMQLRERASEWKTEGLPIAIDYDRKHPKIDRQRLAMAVLERIESRSKPGSVKSVENWLRDEVEPKGHIRSRSRKKPAKLT